MCKHTACQPLFSLIHKFLPCLYTHTKYSRSLFILFLDFYSLNSSEQLQRDIQKKTIILSLVAFCLLGCSIVIWRSVVVLMIIQFVDCYRRECRLDRVVGSKCFHRLKLKQENFWLLFNFLPAYAASSTELGL